MKVLSFTVAALGVILCTNSLGEVIIVEGICNQYCDKRPDNRNRVRTLVASTASDADAKAAALVAEEKYYTWTVVARCTGAETGWYASSYGQRLPQYDDNKVFNNSGVCGMKSSTEAIEAVIRRCSEKSSGACDRQGNLWVNVGQDVQGQRNAKGCFFTFQGELAPYSEPVPEICRR